MLGCVCLCVVYMCVHLLTAYASVYELMWVGMCASASAYVCISVYVYVGACMCMGVG